MTSLKSMDKKRLSTKSAAIEVDDLLLEILLRLPLYSIQRFLTTCKQWESLITNPTFRKLWRKRNLKPSTGHFLTVCRPRSFLTYLVLFSPNKPTTRFLPRLSSNFWIIQSCNGLLLISTGNDQMNLVYHVYNPTTNTCYTLPQVPGGEGEIKITNLAFDLNRSPHYTVICIFINYPYNFRVYSSDTRCWKVISNYPNDDVNGKGVYWNGAIHWISVYKYYDVENETFKTMPPLGVHENRTSSYYFGESCGRLNYAKLWTPGSSNSSNVDVYELKRDYSEWVFKYHVELDDIDYIISVVHGVDEEEENPFLVLMKGKKIVRYNLVSKTFGELVSSTRDGIFLNHTFQYIESLCDV